MSTSPTPSADDMKRLAARRAMDFVRPGMRLGLGTGSTAKHFVDLVGEAVAGGLKVICVPTSEATRAQAESLNIPLTDLDATPELDLTVDGADEFDLSLRLVKGGGGALLREKIVAAASASMIVITDGSKKVETLGRFPLPVEVTPFGLGATLRGVEAAGKAAGCEGRLVLRKRADGSTFVTDGGHYIIDCHFGVVSNPELLSQRLFAVPGVMEHGLFIGLARTVICAEGSEIRLYGASA